MAGVKAKKKNPRLDPSFTSFVCHLTFKKFINIQKAKLTATEAVQNFLLKPKILAN